MLSLSPVGVVGALIAPTNCSGGGTRSSLTGSALLTLGNQALFAPLRARGNEDPLLGEFGSRLAGVLAEHKAHHRVPAELWQRIVLQAVQRRLLRIAIIGSSITAGCGAIERSPECQVAHSWGRRFHDALIRELHAVPGWPARIETRIHYKNAVAPSFFGGCTSAFLPADTGVILFDFSTNAWESLGLLNATLRQILRVAPHAVPLFVNWPLQDRSRTRVMFEKLDSASASIGADSLSIQKAALQLQQPVGQGAGQPPPAQSHTGFFYASQNEDTVHPSARGHKLLAALALQHLLTGLVGAWCSLFTREQQALENTSERRQGPSAQGVLGSSMSPEVCLPSADGLPVRYPKNSSWQLVDEGVSKRIPKLGLVSTQPGERLSIELPFLPVQRSCATVLVTLGFLKSTRSNQGGFSISCTGCPCCAHLSWDSASTVFPEVTTVARRMGNVAVTATTTFLAGHNRSGDPCTLQILHKPQGGRDPQSRIRIDSLYVREALKWDERFDHAATMSASQRRAKQDYLRFRDNCLEETRLLNLA